MHLALPDAWPAHVRSALVHAFALAHLGMTHVRGWCADSRIARVRLASACERLRAEVGLLREELRIKDARMARIAPRERPHYPPPERLAILQLRAARGWSAEQVARCFLLTSATIASWNRRLDEDGLHALVQLPVPVNRFPDFVGHLVQQLKTLCPAMDQGSQFQNEYRQWCARHGVKPRFGAVGRYGSIAVIERFMRTLKCEGFRRTLVPLGNAQMRQATSAFVLWYNEHRPHSSLAGATPREVYEGLLPANRRPRFEPRARYPGDGACAAPRVAARVQPGAELRLVVSRLEGAEHLPLVELERAA